MSEHINLIPSRIKNAAVGGHVAGTEDIIDDTLNKTQQQINTSFQAAIEGILALIPSAATALNQLADKAFVNSSIATDSATFRDTYNLVSDLSLAVDATHAQIATALLTAISTADNNDYAFVQIPTSADTPTEIRVTERYKFNGTAWAYEYDLNNSGFTAAQWAAINSGITLALVTKLGALPTASELAQALNGKQNTLTFDSAPVSGSQNPVYSGGLYTLFAAIDAKMPSAASASNKLVDENRLAAYVAAIIGALDASYNVTSTDGHVSVNITQADGVITSLQVLTSDIASATALTALGTRVTQAEVDIVALQNAYAAIQGQSVPQVIQPSDTWPVANPSQTVIYRVIDRENTPPTYYCDYMWDGNGTTLADFILMGKFDNAIDDAPTSRSNNLANSGGIYNYPYDRVFARNLPLYPNTDHNWFSGSGFMSIIVPVDSINGSNVKITAGASRCTYSLLTNMPTESDVFGTPFSTVTTDAQQYVAAGETKEVLTYNGCQCLCIVVLEGGSNISPSSVIVDGTDIMQNIDNLIRQNNAGLLNVGKKGSYLSRLFPNNNGIWYKNEYTRSVVIPCGAGVPFKIIRKDKQIIYTILSDLPNGSTSGNMNYVSDSAMMSGNNCVEGITPENTRSILVLTHSVGASDDYTPEHIFVDGIDYSTTMLSQMSSIQKSIEKVFTVGKTGSEDFNSLLEGVLTATMYKNSKLFVGDGTYNLKDEFEDYYGSNFFTSFDSNSPRGLILKNGIQVYFGKNTKVTFNYDGDNNDVKTLFSPFNSGGGGFLIDGANVECSNCRYAFHDELVAVEDSYKNVYHNCHFYKDNRNNAAWPYVSIIGGGLGRHGYIEVSNCVFDYEEIEEGVVIPIVSWHNCGVDDLTIQSRLHITGNFFSKKGTFRMGWIGTSELMTTAYVSNNSLGGAMINSQESSSSTVENTEIVEWNNIIRS